MAQTAQTTATPQKKEPPKLRHGAFATIHRIGFGPVDVVVDTWNVTRVKVYLPSDGRRAPWSESVMKVRNGMARWNEAKQKSRKPAMKRKASSSGKGARNVKRAKTKSNLDVQRRGGTRRVTARVMKLAMEYLMSGQHGGAEVCAQKAHKQYDYEGDAPTKRSLNRKRSALNSSSAVTTPGVATSSSLDQLQVGELMFPLPVERTILRFLILLDERGDSTCVDVIMMVVALIRNSFPVLRDGITQRFAAQSPPIDIWAELRGKRLILLRPSRNYVAAFKERMKKLCPTLTTVWLSESDPLVLRSVTSANVTRHFDMLKVLLCDVLNGKACARLAQGLRSRQWRRRKKLPRQRQGRPPLQRPLP